MRNCNWFGFSSRKKMLDTLCDGSEEFVIAENKENEMEFAQFTKEEDGKFYAEVAFVLPGSSKKTHLCAPDSLTLDEVNVLLDQFESGTSMEEVCGGWEGWEKNSDVGASPTFKIGVVILIIIVLGVVSYVIR